MSNTLRHVDYNWTFETPKFDKWNEHRLIQRPVRSIKDQKKDRSGYGKQGGKYGHFTKGNKNSLWNLRRKNEQMDLMEREALIDGDDLD